MTMDSPVESGCGETLDVAGLAFCTTAANLNLILNFDGTITKE